MNKVCDSCVCGQVGEICRQSCVGHDKFESIHKPTKAYHWDDNGVCRSGSRKDARKATKPVRQLNVCHECANYKACLGCYTTDYDHFTPKQPKPTNTVTITTHLAIGDKDNKGITVSIHVTGCVEVKVVCGG